MRLKEADSKFITRLRRMESLSPSLGGDPEFFIAGKDGSILPSDKFFPDKYHPVYTERVWKDFGDFKNGVFFDGIQAEINPAPQYCREYFNRNIRELLLLVRKTIKKNKIVIKPSVRVLKKVLDDADPEAKIFGCQPDFNAYTQTTNTPEMDASKHYFRYAGGHMHLGASSPYVKKGTIEYNMVKEPDYHLRIIKFMDLMVGIISVIFDTGPDAKRRRTKYGLAGCFRPTPYGIEYRTPSCWWLTSPALASIVYGMARLGWNMVKHNLDEEFRKHVGAEEGEVRRICDESDVKAAKKMWVNMRPYIAYTASPYFNTFHAASYEYGDNYHNWTSTEINKLGGLPKSKLAGTDSVFTLPAFDYMISNGLDAVLPRDLNTAWSLDESLHDFDDLNGAISCFGKALRDNKDFLNYQKTYFEQVL